MKIGDRVIYVGNKEGKTQNTGLIGGSGIILKSGTGQVWIMWDSDSTTSCVYCHNLILHKDHYIRQFKAIYEQV